MTTVEGASATYGDDRLRAGVAMAMDTIVDMVHRLTLVPDLSTAPDASLASRHEHALSNAHAVHVARAGVDRAENPVVLPPPDNRRAMHHHVASRRPVVLLSARRQLCCMSTPFLQNQLLTFVDRLMNLTGVDPDYSNTFELMLFPPRSLSLAEVYA